ncbi:hypothetical protein M0G74_10480 [Microbulbifer sp. CAU 1566]|uniref:hypothetical protein n=1 Tax=Microbulbifer sp. CAU 1566 TaxID=2933269 RepID=UPI002004F1D3|nr:hypothetical protein [Microbulbifer sp. CAU 1566]MCK7597694.1 hypothetical protein [Microbulbifer sp. CAU 1566]
MTLSDRRLVIELGAVLIIKLALITLIKIHYFSPDPEQAAPVPAHFFPRSIEEPAESTVPVIETTTKTSNSNTQGQNTDRHDKER